MAKKFITTNKPSLKCTIDISRDLLLSIYAELVKDSKELTDDEKNKMIDITTHSKAIFISMINMGNFDGLSNIESAMMAKLREHVGDVVSSHTHLYKSIREEESNKKPTNLKNRFTLFIPTQDKKNSS